MVLNGCEGRGHTVHSNSNSLSEELSPLGIASCLLCLSSCVVRLVSCVSRCVLGPVSSLATGQYYRVQASLPRPFVIHDLIRASKTGRGLGVGWVLHSVSVVRTSTTTIGRVRVRVQAFSSHTLFPTRTQQIRRRARGPGALDAPGSPGSPGRSKIRYSKVNQNPETENRTPNFDTRTSNLETRDTGTLALGTGSCPGKRQEARAQCTLRKDCAVWPLATRAFGRGRPSCDLRLPTGDR